MSPRRCGTWGRKYAFDRGQSERRLRPNSGLMLVTTGRTSAFAVIWPACRFGPLCVGGLSFEARSSRMTASQSGELTLPTLTGLMMIESYKAAF